MTKTILTVPIGQIATSTDSSDVLVVYGLGSCILVCMYDPLMKIGGVLHALLPTFMGNNHQNYIPTKFVDAGIPLLVNSLQKLGARRSRLVTNLCGGAQIINTPSFNHREELPIGKRNIIMAESTLAEMGFNIEGWAIGGYVGRTVKLYIDNGLITVKTLGQGETPLRPGKRYSTR